jgi:hypothetical protein
VQGFARREFQLMLLRRMADLQPDLVEAAYTELGATNRDYLAAHNRWQSMLRSRRAPRGLDLYHAVLGPADDERARRFGDVSLAAHTWALPGLWPDLRWEALVGTAGVVIHAWLVRAGDAPIPELPAPADMAPWSCVVGDVLYRFPEAAQFDPQVPSQWRLAVGGTRMTFVHGLLQLAQVADPGTE